MACGAACGSTTMIHHFGRPVRLSRRNRDSGGCKGGMTIRTVLTRSNCSGGDVVARAKSCHLGDSAMCPLTSVRTIMATVATCSCIQLVHHGARSKGNDAAAVVESVTSVAA